MTISARLRVCTCEPERIGTRGNIGCRQPSQVRSTQRYRRQLATGSLVFLMIVLFPGNSIRRAFDCRVAAALLYWVGFWR